MIKLFKKNETKEAKPYKPPVHSQPDSKLYNEMMKHQHEMRKQLYRKLKLE